MFTDAFVFVCSLTPCSCVHRCLVGVPTDALSVCSLQGGASERSERAVNSITLEDLLGRCDVCANNVVKLMKGLADYRTLQVLAHPISPPLAIGRRRRPAPSFQ